MLRYFSIISVLECILFNERLSLVDKYRYLLNKLQVAF